MSDTQLKNKLLFDFYENIKTGKEILSVEDLEIAIKTMENAKEELKKKEQKRLQQAQLQAIKNRASSLDFKGKVLQLPYNLDHIDTNAYRGNKEIVKVVINYGCSSIGEHAFEGCTNLREVVFPRSKIILRRGCFKNCLSLKEIDIPNISNICPSAFENCISLEKVFLPDTISNIYTKAFSNCRSLQEVDCAPKSEYGWNTLHIYPRVFEKCISLEKLEIYKGYLDNKAFIDCANLKEIYNHYRFGENIKFEKCDAKVICV